MPELPEVEVIRAGVDSWVTGRVINMVEVGHPRAIRRHLAGPADLVSRLVGDVVVGTGRRGKYLWLILGSGDALVIHLGMSGQLLIKPTQATKERHLRVNIGFTDTGNQLRFVDQRTFGGLFLDSMTDAPTPSTLAHIARDPFDCAFDFKATARIIKSKTTAIKRVLLDQSVVSGIGNIYADEALWRTRLNWATPATRIPVTRIVELLGNARDVMAEALAAGGTSFDALYVNVNGSSGYFGRHLAVYGHADLPCPRCGTPVIRERFANRSSYRCPRCQAI